MTKVKVLYDLNVAIATMQAAASTMAEITEEPYAEHSAELLGAATMAAGWAKEIQKEIEQELKQ